MSRMYSKKDKPEVTARVIKEDKKYGSVVLEYLTGDDAGKTTNISTSTLKRWWSVAGECNDEEVEKANEELKKAEQPQEEPEMITKITPPKRKKNPVDAVDRDSKVEYIKLLAERFGVTVTAKPTDKYEIRVYKDEKRLGHICCKLRKFVLYTSRVVYLEDTTKFIAEQTNGGMLKIECLPDDALLEVLFKALVESEDRKYGKN